MLDLEIDRSGAWGEVESTCPQPAEAGSLARWEVRFEPARALGRGALLALARRWPSDWGVPQSGDPRAPDYLTTHTSSGAGLRWWSARLHPWHPFDHVLFVELLDPLAAGERLELRFGDGAQGSPGARVQTFIEEASPLSVRLRPSLAARWIEIADLAARVVGTDAHALVATAPSRVAAGEPFRVHLRVEDAWGNPATGFEGVFELDDGTSVALRSSEGSIAELETTLHAPGVHRLAVRQRAGALAATTNPVSCEAAPAERLYWGDLHGQSLIGCGARTVEQYYRHARDFAGCDFASHQANCFLVSAPEWEETEALSARLNEAGRYVTLLGVEWSAQSHLGGDRNLYFAGDAAELRRCSHQFIADRSDLGTDLPHADDLHAHYRGSDVIVALHVGGRTTDLRWHEPALERLVEVHSTHATSEWFWLEALERGYRMGVCAGSDGVDGRPGASHPGHMGVRNVRGGLTAAAMPALTRETLREAMRARRCYATTGERILVDFEVDGHPFGAEYEASGPPTIRYRVEGTAPLEAVEIWRDTELLHRAPLELRDPSPSQSVRVAWRGASAPGNWQRARMVWDGELRITGARIVEARGHAFDTPDEGITARSETTLAWRSVTAGDWDGVVLDLEDETDARLAFATGPMTFETPIPADTRPVEVSAADPSRTVRVERLPSALPDLHCAGSFVDRESVRETHAYWLRVLQHDGAMAWSSPVFATFAGT